MGGQGVRAGRGGVVGGEPTSLTSAQYGTIYLASDAADPQSGQQEFTRIATYGFTKGGLDHFAAGEGRAGQAGIERKPILSPEGPAGYLKGGSGLGWGAPGGAA